jgi:hypothetical protein
MKYQIRRSTQFKRDVKRAIKRGKDIEQLFFVVQNWQKAAVWPPITRIIPSKDNIRTKGIAIWIRIGF